MLERGHAPRPASSRRSSQSPSEVTSSPASSQPGPARRQDAPANAPPGLGGNRPASSDERAMPNVLRSSGFHDILNPMEQGRPQAGSSPSHPRSTFAGERPPPTMGTRQYRDDGSPSHPYTPQSLPHPGPQSGPPQAHFGIQHASTPGEPPSGPGRDSPGTSHGYATPLGRRILTPRSPRVTSLGRAASRSGETQHHLPLPPPAPRASVPPHDMSPLGGPPSYPGQPFPGHLHGAGPQPSAANESSHSRSLSQPVQGHRRESSHSQESIRDQGVRPVIFSPGPQYPPSHPPRGPPSGHGPTSSVGENRWSSMGSMSVGMSGSRTITVAEGQHVLTITPTHGEEIMVPVDMHQASKQADEKRQRNAGASARFRQRKKEREKEQQAGLQRLEAINRELENRLREAEVERDFYRGERNRFRSLVAQTPGISEYAERAPPSPTRSSRSGGSFAADNSPLPGPPPSLHHPHPLGRAHPPPYDPSMAERPTRRRRTDPEPQFTTPSYGPPPPSTLPPMVPQSYGMSPSPHPSPHPSNGSARLPPLRLDPSPSPEYQLPPTTGPPPPSLPPPPIPQSQQPQHPHYPAWSRPPQETGWATEPRGPPERGPR